MEITSITSFLSYFEGIRERTLRVVRLIPADKLEWRYAPDRFSCGDLVRHLAATERYMFAENVQGKPSRYPGHGPELVSGLNAVLEYFERLHSEAMEIFGSLSETQLRQHCITPAGTEITTWKWLRAMLEHEVHHRGQIYMILGMLGVPTPPLYGLTEPEVLARSVSKLELRTARLLLRPLELQDVPRYHEILTQPEVRRYLLDDTIVPIDWVEAEIRQSLGLFQKHHYGTWAVTHPETGEIIGFCGFRCFFETAELQLFYGLDPRQWGRGYASEAAAAVVRYAFEVLGFERVVAATDPPNAASIRVLERVGMSFDHESLHDGRPTVYYVARPPSKRAPVRA